MPKKTQPEAQARTVKRRSRSCPKMSHPPAAKTVRRGDGETGREGRKKRKTAKKESKRAGVPAVPSVKTKAGRSARGPVAKAWTADQTLENGQWETFCQKMALGVFSNYSCYLQAYPDSSVEAARSSSADLLTKPNIRERIAWIREDALKGIKESIEKAVKWYQAVIDTPVGFIDEESPLAQEVTREEVTTQADREAGEIVTKVKIKIPDKIKARERIDKLMGFEKVDKDIAKAGDAIVDLVSWIRNGANNVPKQA